MKRPRWLRSDVKPRIREEKIVENMDANEPRKSHGSYRLREETPDPKIKESEVRPQRDRTPRFRKEAVVIDEKSVVRHTKAKPHLREEKPADKSNKEIRASARAKKFDPEQYAKHAEIERRLSNMRRPNRNNA